MYTRQNHKSQSSNHTLRHRYTSFRPSDTLAIDSYAYKVIQSSRIQKNRNIDSDSDPDSDYSDSSSSEDDNQRNVLFKLSDIDLSDTKDIKKHKKRLRKKQNKELLRLKIQMYSTGPITPTPYAGKPDLQRYTRFVLEVNQYMVQSGLYHFPKSQVSIMLSFIKGKAIDFYLLKIASYEYCWTLSKFFTRLIDFCFLSNFVEILCRQFNNTV